MKPLFLLRKYGLPHYVLLKSSGTYCKMAFYPHRNMWFISLSFRSSIHRHQSFYPQISMLTTSAFDRQTLNLDNSDIEIFNIFKMFKYGVCIKDFVDAWDSVISPIIHLMELPRNRSKCYWNTISLNKQIQRLQHYLRPDCRV